VLRNRSSDRSANGTNHVASCINRHLQDCGRKVVDVGLKSKLAGV
jgi:hypothetical protein